MYIEIKNCTNVHIFKTKTYIYSLEGIYILDEITTFLVYTMKLSSHLGDIIKAIEEYLSVSNFIARNLLKKIIHTNAKFFSYSETPNRTIITGSLNAAFPESIHISTTNRCMHKCIHCFKECIFQGKDISKYKTMQLLDFLKQNTRLVEFTGGEPFLNSDIVDYVNKYEDYFEFVVSTSAYNINFYPIEFLQKFRLVQVSLHGSNSSTHDGFVQKVGSFDTVTRNIRTLIENKIDVRVTTTLVRYDKLEIINLIKLCISLGVRSLKIGHVVQIGRAKKFEVIDKKFEDEILEFIDRCKNFFMDIEIEYQKDNYIVNPNNQYVYSCYGGQLNWHIDEYENIWSCALCKDKNHIIGNLEDSTIVNDLVYHEMYEKYNNYLIQSKAYERKSIICNKIIDPTKKKGVSCE